MRKLNYQKPHPIWRVMLMTEVFGPVGAKWGIDQVGWKISPKGAAVCVSVWWVDQASNIRRVSDPCWGRVTEIDTDCMSKAGDEAVDAALSQIEENLPFRLIPLTKGYYAIIDAADHEAISSVIWSVFETRWTRYACRVVKRNGKQKMIMMHREIAAAGDTQVVDHENRNGLDNRRRNLRICTNQQNSMNTRSRPGTSRFKGVCLDKRLGKWSAQITINGKKKHLGFFLEEWEAARAYDGAAKDLFGNFANLNFKE
jgi:hypothetical protein